MTLELSDAQVGAGPLVLQGETIIGLVLDDTYDFISAHATAADLVAFEVTGAAYDRLTATARVELLGGAWVVWPDDVTSTDLSDVPARGGTFWVRPGATDADRATIGWESEPGGPIAVYEPTWPSGLFASAIESLDEILAQLRADIDAKPIRYADLTDVDVDPLPSNGNVPVWDVDDEVWRPGPGGEGGGAGAVGTVQIDKSGETPGAITVDLSAVATTVATVVILAPDGGPSTLNIGLPAGTARAPLFVLAYAADESLLTLAFPSAPGAPTFAPSALPGVTVASTGAMTPISASPVAGEWNSLLLPPPADPGEPQPGEKVLPGWCSTEGFGEPGLRWRYVAGQIEFGGSAAWLVAAGDPLVPTPGLPSEPVIGELPVEARPEINPIVVAMEFDLLGESPTFTNVFSPGSINASTGEVGNTTSPISALVRFAYLRWDIYVAP